MAVTIIATLILIALDQFSKHLAVVYLQPVVSMPFIPHVLQLYYVENDGMAFSMFSGARVLLVVVTAVALIGLGVYLLRFCKRYTLEYYGWLLVFGGGLGNFIDRVRQGYVVDFFATLFMDFAVFNVADCFVCVGVGIVFLATILDEVKKKKQKG